VDLRHHRPHRRLGRSERPLVKIAQDLTRFLPKAQRSLRYDTPHLSSRKREILAQILVEFAADLSQDLGLWNSLEGYNLALFGTRLPVSSRQMRRWTQNRSITRASSFSSGRSIACWNLS